MRMKSLLPGLLACIATAIAAVALPDRRGDLLAAAVFATAGTVAAEVWARVFLARGAMGVIPALFGGMLLRMAALGVAGAWALAYPARHPATVVVAVAVCLVVASVGHGIAGTRSTTAPPDAGGKPG